MKELFNNPKEDEYLSEFRQKIAQDIEDDIEQRRHELERSRNGFIGTIAGIVLAGLVSWFLLLPHFGYQRDEQIPVIKRPITPAKIQPSEPGGMNIQNQDKIVYALVEKNEVVDTTVESLLPPPETPKLPTIAASEDTLPIGTNMEELIDSVETTATEKMPIPSKIDVIDVKVKTEPQSSQKVVTVVEKVQVEVAPAPVETKAQSSNTSGRYKVQLMASSKKDALENGYRTMLKQYAVLKNKPYVIEEGSDGLFRLKVGSFDNKKAADDLCAEIKKAGGSCMVKE